MSGSTPYAARSPTQSNPYPPYSPTHPNRPFYNHEYQQIPPPPSTITCDANASPVCAGITCPQSSSRSILSLTHSCTEQQSASAAAGQQCSIFTGDFESSIRLAADILRAFGADGNAATIRGHSFKSRSPTQSPRFYHPVACSRALPSSERLSSRPATVQLKAAIERCS